MNSNTKRYIGSRKSCEIFSAIGGKYDFLRETNNQWISK